LNSARFRPARQRVFQGAEIRLVDIDREATARSAAASLNPTVPISGWLNTAVGTFT